uniref:Putative ovule protein n=1 Tax=Solanum chacoense TaxID=4108 RepID=A0A0V0HEB4_SOLCH
MENENLVEVGKTDLDKSLQCAKFSVIGISCYVECIIASHQLKAEAEATKAAQLSKEIDSLPDIIQEIEREEGEKQKRHLRCVLLSKKTKILSTTLGKAQIRACSCSGLTV